MCFPYHVTTFHTGYILHCYLRNIRYDCQLINCMYLGKWGLYLRLVAEILIFPLTTQIHMYDVFPARSVLLNSWVLP